MKVVGTLDETSPRVLFNNVTVNEFEYINIIHVHCGFKKCMKAILAVMKTIYAVKKVTLEKIQACVGFESMTSAILE